MRSVTKDQAFRSRRQSTGRVLLVTQRIPGHPASHGTEARALPHPSIIAWVYQRHNSYTRRDE